MLTAVLTWLNPVISLLLFTGFTIYEWVEQEKINDDMYRDYVEFLLGMFLTAVVMWLLYIL